MKHLQFNYSQALKTVDCYNLLKYALQLELSKFFTIEDYERKIVGDVDTIYFPKIVEITPQIDIELIKEEDVYFLYICVIKQLRFISTESKDTDYPHIQELVNDITNFKHCYNYLEYEEKYESWLKSIADKHFEDIKKSLPVLKMLKQSDVNKREKHFCLKQIAKSYFTPFQQDKILVYFAQKFNIILGL